MKAQTLVVFGKKRIWKDTNGGSSFYVNDSLYKQIVELSKHFSTTILCAEEISPRKGIMDISGFGFQIYPYRFRLSRFKRKVRFFLNIPFLFWRYVQLIRKADLVYILLPGEIGLAGTILALITNKPMIVRYMMSFDFSSNQIPFGRSYQKILNYLGKRKNTKVFLTQIQSNFGNENGLKQIFSPSLSLEDYKTSSKEIQENKTFKFVYIGRFDLVSKRIDVMIQTFYNLIKNGISGKLTVIGGFKKVHLNLLKGLSESERTLIEKNIEFKGHLNHDEVLNETRKADLLFLFSDKEGFPKTVIEGYSQGVPAVLGTFLTSEFMAGKNQERAILIKDLEPTQIAQRIIELINDPLRYAEMSKNCLEFSKQFSLEAWAQVILGKQSLEIS